MFQKNSNSLGRHHLGCREFGRSKTCKVRPASSATFQPTPNAIRKALSSLSRRPFVDHHRSPCSAKTYERVALLQVDPTTNR